MSEASDRIVRLKIEGKQYLLALKLLLSAEVGEERVQTLQVGRDLNLVI
jgi:hypothetical protein